VVKSIDLKYLIAYLAPLLAALGILWAGWWSYGAAILSFVVLPLYELIKPPTGANLSPTERNARSVSRYYDWLLYSHVPLLFILIAGSIYRVSFTHLETWELVGLVLSMGVTLGTFGINVAHELGHRSTAYEQAMAKLLLLPNLYMHFIVEHNRGHHRYVSTPLDPATARYGENLYFFWIRSTVTGYFSAWRIEAERLVKAGKNVISVHNQMIVFTLLQLLYLALIFALCGPTGFFFAVAIAVMGFLLLESINYVEHYGLVRKMTGQGRYEKVTEMHSWESNHDLGRIFLYELTRHAHHHSKASVKYQLLDHTPDSPQMPTGYPGMIIMALIPPLFYWVVNPRVPAEMKALAIH